MEKGKKEPRDENSKLEDQVKKQISSASTTEEKLNLLVKKYVEIEKENKKCKSSLTEYQKSLESTLKQKTLLEKEYNKSLLIKDKLEDVCREQQKLIKSVKNESLSKIREEEERRKENQIKFQQSINEINQTLTKNNDENNKLRDDNIEMTKKLKYLAEQYETREKQLEKINEQVSLEKQLNEAKLAKAQMEAAIEKEVLLREKQKSLDELLQCKKLIKEMQLHENALKEQLNLYNSKYDEFQSSLTKSNSIFVTYKAELEKLSKTIKKLEKENLELKRKMEKSNATLIELSTEKQVKDEYVAKSARQVHQLKKLLRTLQAERTLLHTLLKDNNIERPDMPVLPPEPEHFEPPPVAPPQQDKMEIMQKNCAELKQTLAMLQSQMCAVTAKQAEVEQSKSSKCETAAPPGEKKKNKKKNKNKNRVCPTKDTASSSSIPVECETSVEKIEVNKNSEMSIQDDANEPNIDIESSDKETNLIEKIEEEPKKIDLDEENVASVEQTFNDEKKD